jgi:hypothetical protein
MSSYTHVRRRLIATRDALAFDKRLSHAPNYECVTVAVQLYGGIVSGTGTIETFMQ